MKPAEKSKKTGFPVSLRMILIGVLLLAISFSGTFAWLANVWNSKQITFTAGTTAPPEIEIWQYTTAEEATESGDSEGWKSFAAETVGEYSQIPSNGIVPESDGSTCTYTLSSLQFGTVDSLARIKEDNTVYLCAKFDPKRQGTTTLFRCRFGKDNGRDYIRIYDKDNIRITDSASVTVNADLKALNETNPFLTFAYATDTQYHGTADAVAGLTYTALTDTEVTLNAADPEAPYYIYIKITPDLGNLAKFTGVLNRLMPCLLDFDIDLEFTSYTVPQA